MTKDQPAAPRDPIAEHIAQSPFGDDEPPSSEDALCARLRFHAERGRGDPDLLREAALRIEALTKEHTIIADIVGHSAVLSSPLYMTVQARVRELVALLSRVSKCMTECVLEQNTQIALPYWIGEIDAALARAAPTRGEGEP